MNNNPSTKNRAPIHGGEILVGSALDRLRDIPTGSVDTVVTSPPYFRLRNYGVNGQIGAEDTVDEWVNALVAVLAEVARVLKPAGSVWLNLGDTFSRREAHGAPPKGLVLAPERLLLALNASGWSCRNKVIWAKPNPMPASVKDRLSATWEPLYLLTRSKGYFFDLDAIRIPGRSNRGRPTRTGADTKHATTGTGRPSWAGPNAGNNSGLPAMKARGQSTHPLGKNPGDVWQIPTAAYRGAHFATFPEALVERPLRATCPERVCVACGTAWRRAPYIEAVGRLAVAGALRKSCGCESRDWQPGLVLDPFMGAGTVAVVAKRLGRRWRGIELNPAYARLAEGRVGAADGPKASQPPEPTHI
jgi:DNA modification methylase